jgi:hypothetical protein
MMKTPNTGALTWAVAYPRNHTRAIKLGGKYHVGTTV